MTPFLRWIVGPIAALLVAISTPVWAAGPTNDFCQDAIVIPGSGPFPFLTTPVDIIEASTNADPVLPPEGGDCRSAEVSASVWYRFTPAATGNYTISTCTDTATTVSDTLLALYTASGACNGFTLVDCGDDECGIRSAIQRQLAAGTTYYIVVWSSGEDNPPTNASIVQLRISLPPPVPNDMCAGAEVIPGSGPFPYLAAVADTRLAGTAGDPPAPLCPLEPGFSLDRSVWYRFTPTATGLYNLSLCEDTATTVYDTHLAIYTAPSCSGPFTRVACNADAREFQSAIVTNLNAGTTYYIVAWDPDHTEGESLIQLRVSSALPRITSGMRQAGGAYEVNFTANISQRYTVQAATNLTGPWTSVRTINDTNGAAMFVDTNAVILPQRFYRIRTP